MNVDLSYNTVFYFARAGVDWNNERIIQFFI